MCTAQKALPNPSLEWTATGKALGPPACLGHHPSSVPSAFPASAPSAQTLGRMTITRLPRTHCIYCGAPASTRDHVPPKVLLDQPYPPNLRTVPSCRDCNSGASLDEQYFLVLLGHVASSRSIEAKLAPGGLIDRTLSYAPALEERLLRALDVDEDTGNPVIKPEMQRVKRVVQKIAVGLFALRYGRAPAGDQVSHVGLYPYKPKDERPLPYFIATFTERFKSKQWRNVQCGAFSYIFVRDPRHSGKVWCVMDISQSLWAVVHLPNPKSAKLRSNQQLWLFPGNAA